MSVPQLHAYVRQVRREAARSPGGMLERAVVPRLQGSMGAEMLRVAYTSAPYSSEWNDARECMITASKVRAFVKYGERLRAVRAACGAEREAEMVQPAPSTARHIRAPKGAHREQLNSIARKGLWMEGVAKSLLRTRVRTRFEHA